ncbi:MULTISPECIES: GNAT family N-acetyltransferase [unclassified Paenibacillus]|uniref:GNAT family N-acetyltransferase n=1 Tax=unclassified Paenibacillus TaxID=185978 RepID=UPI000FE1FC08|nr:MULTISPECIES: GNAT family N-acetyltransferase [unclassified Paenibacillus]MCM3171891.1 GNAT family N-acetyltransferase [Paenibacillus sp. MER 99-2]
MQIEIKNVDQNNLSDIISLRVHHTQQDYIETPAKCLQDAKDCPFYQPVGLYVDGVLVGFAMYGLFPNESEDGRVWLDRYLIDMQYQGRGLGKILLQSLIDHMVCLYSCTKIYLSLYENNKAAMKLYTQFGFRLNGEKDINGEHVMVKLI